jgi:hypothetical protein
MNAQEFNKLVEGTIKTTAELLIVKGGEYAGSEDRLANFKRNAQLTGSTPLQVALVYMSKHFDALCTYIRDEATGVSRPRSEPIEGRLDDLINYCFLIKGLVTENQQGSIARAMKAADNTVWTTPSVSTNHELPPPRTP